MKRYRVIVNDTYRASNLETTIMHIANEYYQKYSSLKVNMSQKELDGVIDLINESEELKNLVELKVREFLMYESTKKKRRY